MTLPVRVLSKARKWCCLWMHCEVWSARCRYSVNRQGDLALPAAHINKHQLPSTILNCILTNVYFPFFWTVRRGHARGDITLYFLLIWGQLLQNVEEGNIKKKKRKTPLLAYMSTPCMRVPAWVPFHVCHGSGIWWWSVSFLCSHFKQGRGDLHE